MAKTTKIPLKNILYTHSVVLFPLAYRLKPLPWSIASQAENQVFSHFHESGNPEVDPRSSREWHVLLRTI